MIASLAGALQRVIPRARRPQLGQIFPVVNHPATICQNGGMNGSDAFVVEETRLMFRSPQAEAPARPRRGWRGALVAGLAAFLSACSGGMPSIDIFNNQSSPPPAADQGPQAAIGSGQIKVALLLPLSASGNSGLAGQSMRNAAELALTEFNNPNIQLLVKDDGGSGPGAQQAAQQALDEGAEIMLGPLFAQSVTPA